MRLRILTIFAVLATTIAAHAALNAAQVMDRVAAVFTKPASVTVAFSIEAGNKQQSGTLTMGKRLFTFNAGGLAVWFDGKNQWTVDRQAREVTITAPTPAEVAESNPFALITDHAKLFTPTLQPSDKGVYKVCLTRKSKALSIKNVFLTVDARTFHVRTLTATDENGGKMTVTIKKIQTGKALPKTYYTYNTKAASGYDINDLR